MTGQLVNKTQRLKFEHTRTKKQPHNVPIVKQTREIKTERRTLKFVRGWGGKARSYETISAATKEAYLHIKFPEEVNKSAMKTTCYVLNTRLGFFSLFSVANIKTRVVQT